MRTLVAIVSLLTLLVGCAAETGDHDIDFTGDGDFSSEDDALSYAGSQYFGGLRDALSYVRSSRTVEEYMLALPRDYRESFVLMERSNSNHVATTANPRIIMFGTDSRSMVAVSSNPADPHYHVAEVVQLRPDGYWQFAQVDFRSGRAVINRDGSSCASCHGTPLRPIWGGYPDWPGAFDPEGKGLTQRQVNTLLAARAQGATTRLRLLAVPTNPRAGSTFSLPRRGRYPYANTVFNFELGAAASEGIVRRLRARSTWAQDRRALVRATWCDNSRANRDAVLRGMGLRPNDFRLDQLGNATSGYNWSRGGMSLLDMVAALALSEMYYFDNVGWNDFFYFWYGVRAESRRDYLEGDYYSGFRPQEFVDPYLDNICRRLAN